MSNSQKASIFVVLGQDSKVTKESSLVLNCFGCGCCILHIICGMYMYCVVCCIYWIVYSVCILYCYSHECVRYTVPILYTIPLYLGGMLCVLSMCCCSEAMYYIYGGVHMLCCSYSVLYMLCYVDGVYYILRVVLFLVCTR